MKVNPIAGSLKFASSPKINTNSKANNPIYNDFQNENLPIASCEHLKANFLSPVSTVAFTGATRATSNFELKDIYGIDCPCCGDKMMTASQSRKLVSKVKDSTGSILQRHLSKGFDYYKPNEKRIVETIIETSKERPEMNLKEIVQYKAKTSKKALEERQLVILEEMREDGKKLDKKRSVQLNQILDDTIEEINNSTDEKHFKRGEFLTKIGQMEHEKGDGVYEGLCKKAAKLPTTHDNVHAFFVKYSRKEGEEIAQRLFSSSTVTTEHVIPKSKGGPDSTENYIPLCGACNSTRSNMPYNEWFKVHPEMPENLQRYINKIAPIIEEGQFQGASAYKDYVDEVIESVKKATDGKLVLRKPNTEDVPVEREPEKPAPDRELTIDEKRQYWLDEYNYLYARLQELKTTRDSLQGDEEFKRICTYVSALQLATSLKMQKSSKSSEINQIRRSINAAENTLKKAQKDKDKQKEKDAKTKIEQRTQKLEEAKSQYDEIAARESVASEKLKKAERKITHPGDVQKKINVVEANLSKRRDLQSRITTLHPFQAQYNKTILGISLLDSEIEKRTEENEAKRKDIDFDSDANVAAVKEYNNLKMKLKMIDSVDRHAFQSVFKYAPISPDFLLDEPREQIEANITKLAETNDAVAFKYEQDEIAKKEDERAKLKETVPTLKEKTELLKKALQEQQLLVLQEGKDEVVEKKLNNLRERKKSLELKFASVDIEKQIHDLKIRTNDALMRYTSSFEEYDYRQDSIDRANAASPEDKASKKDDIQESTTPAEV